MFGRISALAVAAAMLTASPAFAETFSQDAPTSYLGQNTAAVLSKGVSYFSAGGTGINYATAMAGGELGLGLNGAFRTAGGLGTGIGLNAGYKFPLSRMAGMAAAVAVSGTLAGLGGNAGMSFGGAGVDVPLTMDMGGSLLSITPNVRTAVLTNPMATLSLGADVGVQYPVAPFWSVLGSVMPSFALQGGAITAPVVLGARLSPTSTSHVDFRVMDITTAPGFGLNAGTIAVTGHIGWR